MADRRESILARLLAIAQGTGLFTEVARNKQDVTGKRRPAFILLDADEEASEDTYGRGRPPSTPDLVKMTPQMYIMVESRHENLGAALNVLRAALVKAIKTDTQLPGMVGTSGQVQYEGCTTDLGKERQMAGEMILAFSFTYPLKHQEL